MKKSKFLSGGLVGAVLLAAGAAAIMLTSQTKRTVCPGEGSAPDTTSAVAPTDTFEHHAPISFLNIPEKFSHSRCCDVSFLLARTLFSDK